MIASLLTLLLAIPVQADGASDPLTDLSEFTERFTALEGTHPAQWRVVWTEEPQTRATLSWTTAEPGTDHRVLYDTRPLGAERFEFEAPAARSGAYTRSDKDQQAPTYFHHVRLAGLEPSTRVRFVVESDGVRSPELWFETAPDDQRSIALLVGGDSRSGTRARAHIHTAIADLAEADASVLAFSHGGDFVMFGDRFDNWSSWLTHFELCTGPSGRVLPILPTRGNHDWGPLFDEVFDAPGGAQRNTYRTRLSPHASLLTLNSNISVGGDQLLWLEQTLEQAAADSTFLIPNYHRALYPAVKLPGDALPFWPPVFDRFRVDLALESDGHVMKRTVAIRDGEPHADGVVYIGEGGLGVPQRRPLQDPWYLAEPGFARPAHHLIRLDFEAELCTVEFLEVEIAPSAADPIRYEQVVSPGAEWAWELGPAETASWTAPGFDDSAWSRGPAGFGYGDADDATVLLEMEDAFEELRIRHSFEGDGLTGGLALFCSYDDAFVATLNGTEVARGGFDGERVGSHEARGFERFPLRDWRDLLIEGPDVLCITGFNSSKRSSDFSLHPALCTDRPSDAPDAATRTVSADRFTLSAKTR